MHVVERALPERLLTILDGGIMLFEQHLPVVNCLDLVVVQQVKVAEVLVAVTGQVLALGADVCGDADELCMLVSQSIFRVDLQWILGLLSWMMRQRLVLRKESHNFVVLLVGRVLAASLGVLGRIDLLVKQQLGVLHRDDLLEDRPLEVQRVTHL